MTINMEVFFLCIGVVGLIIGIIAWRSRQREKKRLAELSGQIEHFLLYAEEPLPETLEEGALANLRNQTSRLENQLLYQRGQSGRREREMTRFVENMAHQMKNAVTALQIRLDLLSVRMPPEERPSIEKSWACLERLTDEIDRVLKSSQLAAGKIAMEFEPVALTRELRVCAGNLKPLASSRRVSVETGGPDGLFVPADPFWLPQALENILKNALEHTPEGGTVTGRISDEGNCVRIRIEDEGPGIPPEELPELFTRFHRGSAMKAGYGVGLSMAKDVVEAHHGVLTAGNRERTGAWFEIQLPVMDGAKAYPPRNEPFQAICSQTEK